MLALLIMSFFVISELISLFFVTNFDQSTTKKAIPANDEPLWTLKPQQFTMAVAFINNSGKTTDQVKQYVNMYFYQYSKSSSGVDATYYKAVDCKELHSDQKGSKFYDQFEKADVEGATDYLCADTNEDHTIEFQGEPYFGKTGKNFNFGIASCAVAAQSFGESDDDCLDPTSSEGTELLENVSILHKIIHQYFNLDIFIAQDELESVSSYIKMNNLLT